MSAYVVAQLRFRDEPAYRRYQRGFADGSKAKPEIVKAREQMLGQPSKPDK